MLWRVPLRSLLLMPFGNLPSCVLGRTDGRGRRFQQPLWQKRAVLNIQFSNAIQEKWSEIQNIIGRHLSASIAFSFVFICFYCFFVVVIIGPHFLQIPGQPMEQIRANPNTCWRTPGAPLWVPRGGLVCPTSLSRVWILSVEI